MAFNFGDALSGYNLYEQFRPIKSSYTGQTNQFLADLGGSAGDLQRIGRAMTDVNDPLYRQFAQEEEQTSKQDFAEALQQLINQNRRQQGMGRTPLFDAERGGEVIFRGTTRAAQDAKTEARNRALQRLGMASDAARQSGSLYGQAANVYGAREQQQMAQQAQNRLQRGGAVESLISFLPRLTGLF